MHRFYIPETECAGPEFPLTGPEAHHAISVLRIRPGETVEVLTGTGAVVSCEIARVDRRSLGLRVKSRRQPPPPLCQITLFQCLPKGKIFESIIQKSTELGVAAIVPVLSSRVVTQLDSASGTAKAARWRQVAIEAVKQCGQPWLPKVLSPIDLNAGPPGIPTAELCLVASLESGSRPIRHFFGNFLTANRRLPGSVEIWVGPEGDFSPEELRRIGERGARPVTLGPLVLRVETAAIYCLSVINHELLPGITPGSGVFP